MTDASTSPERKGRATADDLAIDADGHVHEEDALFSDYLEPAYRDRTLGWALNADRNRRFVVDGEEHPPFPKEISVRKPMPPESRIKVLDKERIRLAVLYPSAALVAGYLEPDFSHAAMRAYNSWMADWCGTFPHRLKFAASVALHDIDEAVREASVARLPIWAPWRLRSVPTRLAESGSTIPTGSRSTPPSRSSACRWSCTNRPAIRRPRAATGMAG